MRRLKLSRLIRIYTVCRSVMSFDLYPYLQQCFLVKIRNIFQQKILSRVLSINFNFKSPIFTLNILTTYIHTYIHTYIRVEVKRPCRLYYSHFETSTREGEQKVKWLHPLPELASSEARHFLPKASYDRSKPMKISTKRAYHPATHPPTK